MGVISFIVTTVVALLVFGLVVFIHELGHFIVAKKSDVKVNEFAIGMGPTLFKKIKGETTYAIRLLPIGGFVSMEGEDAESDDSRSFQNINVFKKMAITVAGATMNLILGFIVLVILVSTMSLVPTKTIASFEDGALSQQSGLQVNDEIIAVNGRRCFINDDVAYEFVRIKDGTAEFTVIRDGNKIVVPNVEFKTTTQEDIGEMIVQDYKLYGKEKTFLNVLNYSANWGLSMGRMVFLSLIDLITGNIPVSTLQGPVGIVGIISDAVSIGYQPVLMFLALISINLGIFNLLPIPALDGGRLFLLLIEAIRRKPIKQKYEIAIHLVGFVLLISLMLFATFNDISRLFN